MKIDNKTQVIVVSNIMTNFRENELGKKKYRSAKHHDFLDKISIDLPLFLLLLILMMAGTWILYSASGGSEAIIKKQIMHYIIGFFLMVVLAQIRVVQLQHMAFKLYIVSVILLFIVLFTSTSKGSSRWLNLYFFNIQPSELIKVILPVFVAFLVSKFALPLKFSTILLSLVAISIPAVLIYLQPDLGTMIIVIVSGISILFFAGLSWSIIIGGIIAIASILPLIWHFALHSYQKSRVLTFLDPESNPFGSGWNIIQSQVAIGSGGIFGKGWSQGTQAQLGFLPESHTDFIFAVLAEEGGLLGVCALFLIYFAIILRCFFIAASSTTIFAKLVVNSIAIIFFIYIIINTCMTSGLLPVVGVPLPLISYGGSSIVSLLASFGIVMSVHSRHNRQLTVA